LTRRRRISKRKSFISNIKFHHYIYRSASTSKGGKSSKSSKSSHKKWNRLRRWGNRKHNKKAEKSVESNKEARKEHSPLKRLGHKHGGRGRRS